MLSRSSEYATVEQESSRPYNILYTNADIDGIKYRTVGQYDVLGFVDMNRISPAIQISALSKG
jgi:hypothetical protein